MPPTPLPPTPEPKDNQSSNTTPGDFNQAQLETVRKSEGLAQAAKKTEYHSQLITDGMEEATPDALIAKGIEWRDLSSKALGATNSKELKTGEGEDSVTSLRREVEFYRAKARIALNKRPEWTDSQKTGFKDRYFIGKDIFTSRALTEQAAREIFAHGTEDKLPAITAERQKTTAAILAAYVGTETPQTNAQSEATTLRQQRDATYDEVLRLRREIQLTADSAWPWHNEANLGRRREFLLPAGRAFVG